MNTITSPHMTTPAQDTPSFHAKGNAYLASIKQQTTKLQTEKVIDYVQDNNGSLLTTIGDIDNSPHIILFTHDRHGVELTSELGLALLQSDYIQSGHLKSLIDQNKLALMSIFCSNPNGIIQQTRHLGRDDGADMMRSSKIVPHRDPRYTYNGAKDRIIASSILSGDNNQGNHLDVSLYPLPPEAQFQQHTIEAHLRQGQHITHIDIHTDPTEGQHRILFSPAHLTSYTKLLDGQPPSDRQGKQFTKISDFYEQVRRIVTKSDLPLRYSYQQYRSVGDPIDYHTAKSVRDNTYHGFYRALTYEIPTMPYLIRGLIDGSAYMPHPVHNIIHYPFHDKQMILSPSQLYNIPTTDIANVSTIYTHNIGTLLQRVFAHIT